MILHGIVLSPPAFTNPVTALLHYLNYHYLWELLNLNTIVKDKTKGSAVSAIDSSEAVEMERCERSSQNASNCPSDLHFRM